MAAEKHKLVCPEVIRQHFPSAIPQPELMESFEKVIRQRVGSEAGILFATSCCPDEINRDLDEVASHTLGRPFTMGGLAGFPFVGKSGFKAFMRHVPDGGVMVVICASHVGVHSDGRVGVVHRTGMTEESDACGSAIGAFEACEQAKGCPNPIIDLFDSQQAFVQSEVAKHYPSIASAENPMVELAYTISKCAFHYLRKILPDSLDFPLIVLSGVQINWESGDSVDWFEPSAISLWPPRTSRPECLMSAFHPTFQKTSRHFGHEDE